MTNLLIRNKHGKETQMLPYDFTLQDISSASKLERTALVFAMDFVDRMMQTPENDCGGFPRAATDRHRFTFVLACRFLAFGEKAAELNGLSDDQAKRDRDLATADGN